MRQALAMAYPPGTSALRRIVGPVIDPWTYARALHLLAMFPLGTAYFVFLVTTLAVGLSLSWTIIGPPMLLLTLYLTRWVGDAEAWTVRHLHRMELRRPPTTIERGSYRSQVWARIIDPTTWTGLVYLFVQFPLGIATFVVLVVWSTVTAVFVAAPVFVSPTNVIGFQPGTLDADAPSWLLSFDGWTIDQPSEAWWLPFVGFALLLAGVHLVNLLSAAHAWWARLMLGSRAPHIVPGAPLDDVLPPIEGGPAGPVGPDDHGPGDPDGPTRRPSEPAGPPPAPAFSDYPAVATPHGSPSSAPIPASARIDEAGVRALAALTPRELEVLRLMARGYSNAEIAEAFVVSEGTVKTHVKRVLAKLEVRDRTQAAVWAFDRGFVLPAHQRDARVVSEPPSAREPVRLRVPR